MASASGGHRPRWRSARFLVADEPVSALDVSIQSQILNLLRDLQARLDFTLLFVAHDLAVVEHLCDRVAVMYLGASPRSAPGPVFGTPVHPYTEALLSAIPVADPEAPTPRRLKGELPSLLHPPGGCSFHPAARSRCRACATRSPAPPRGPRPRALRPRATSAPTRPEASDRPGSSGAIRLGRSAPLG